MASKISLSTLEEEERLARMRLASYRARVYRRNASPMAADMRLRELERKWRGAAQRLRRARARSS